MIRVRVRVRVRARVRVRTRVGLRAVRRVQAAELRDELGEADRHEGLERRLLERRVREGGRRLRVAFLSQTTTTSLQK